MPTYRLDWLASEPAMVPLMVLITGRCDFIGLHICLELLNTGLSVTVFDNFCSSQPEALVKIKQMTHQKLRLIPDDILDQSNLETALMQSRTRAMAHFGGLQAVNESLADRPVFTPM